MTMTNPGLALAVLGNPPHAWSTRRPRYDFSGKTLSKPRTYQLAERWAKRLKAGKYRGYSVLVNKRLAAPIARSGWKWSGRVGSASIVRGSRTVATNPRNSIMRLFRRNPFTAVAKIGSDIPASLMSLTKGSVKDIGMKVGIAAASTVGTTIAGNMAYGFVKPYIPAGIMGGTSERVIKAAFPILIGATAYKFAPLKDDQKKAVLAGSVVAAAMGFLKPDLLSSLVSKIPAIGPQIAAKLTLNGYVSAPSYQGVAGYVSAPSYQGVAGYVSSPTYSGSAPEGVAGLGYAAPLAGTMGSNMPSFLDAQ
jgi:hypothetical protein